MYTANPRSRPLRALLAGALALSALALPAARLASADAVEFKNGSRLEGRIISESDDEVKFTTADAGTMTLRKRDLKLIERADKDAVKADFARQAAAAAALQPPKADAHARLAEWAALHGLRDEAEAEWEKTIAVQPDHAAAHAALGHEKVGGKWLPADEAKRAQGLVKRDGKWIPKADAEKLDRGLVLVDGKWMTPDEAKTAKGLVKVGDRWVTAAEAAEAEKKAKADAERKKKEEEAARNARHDAKEDEALLKELAAGFKITPGEFYRLATDVEDAKFATDLVTSMDRFFPTYNDTFGVKASPKKLLPILVFKAKPAYEAWCRAKGSPPGGYGTYLNGHPQKPAVLYFDTDLRATLYTARHEGGHQFMHQFVRDDGGAWFHEGFGTYFEPDVEWRKYPHVMDPVRAALRGGKAFLPLADLISKSSSLMAGNQEMVYGEGATIHWYLLTGAGGKYKTAYQEFLRKGSIDSVPALEKALGVKLPDLEKEWKEFVLAK
ncbi:MAG: hypothetical protein HYZ53_18660 [Planctomycetes bacterium]|nr:hypothetical protein [Planctomycetota bacterium]